MDHDSSLHSSESVETVLYAPGGRPPAGAVQDVLEAEPTRQWQLDSHGRRVPEPRTDRGLAARTRAIAHWVAISPARVAGVSLVGALGVLGLFLAVAPGSGQVPPEAAPPPAQAGGPATATVASGAAPAPAQAVPVAVPPTRSPVAAPPPGYAQAPTAAPPLAVPQPAVAPPAAALPAAAPPAATALPPTTAQPAAGAPRPAPPAASAPTAAALANLAGTPPQSAPVRPIDLPAAEMYSLAGLTAAPQEPRAGTYGEAKAFCAGLRVGGTGGFRLPEMHEAAKLTEPSYAPVGVYWTRTSDEGFGERAVVWSSRRYRASPIHENYRYGRYLCVRDPVH